MFVTRAVAEANELLALYWFCDRIVVDLRADYWLMHFETEEIEKSDSVRIALARFLAGPTRFSCLVMKGYPSENANEEDTIVYMRTKFESEIDFPLERLGRTTRTCRFRALLKTILAPGSECFKRTAHFGQKGMVVCKTFEFDDLWTELHVLSLPYVAGAACRWIFRGLSSLAVPQDEVWNLLRQASRALEETCEDDSIEIYRRTCASKPRRGPLSHLHRRLNERASRTTEETNAKLRELKSALTGNSTVRELSEKLDAFCSQAELQTMLTLRELSDVPEETKR